MPCLIHPIAVARPPIPAPIMAMVKCFVAGIEEAIVTVRVYTKVISSYRNCEISNNIRRFVRCYCQVLGP